MRFLKVMNIHKQNLIFIFRPKLQCTFFLGSDCSFVKRFLNHNAALLIQKVHISSYDLRLLIEQFKKKV